MVNFLEEPITVAVAPSMTLRGYACGKRGSPAVLLLHGGGQTCHAWRGLARCLADSGYFALAFDARGHGTSDRASDSNYAIDAWARDISEIASWLRHPVALVGASVGGLAAFYAIGAGLVSDCRALVLLDTVIRPNEAGTLRIKRFLSANPDGFASLVDAARAIGEYNPEAPAPDPARLARNLRQWDDGRWRWHWDARFLDAPIGDERARILLGVSQNVKVPTVLLRGGASDVTDDAGVAEMRSAVPHIEITTLPGVDHMISGRTNDAYGAATLAFLERHWPSCR